ncbi:MAG: kelch repeat-containing protein [Myxococcales bacterium]|nr:kelch repeat-containing protein [Myxococcales bacterium]
MAWDSVRRRVVLHGGWESSSLDDTWLFDGSTWTQVSTASGPGARSEHAMVFDEARGVVVLFGGYSSGGLATGTWLWDGVRWTEQMTSSAPSQRARHAMAYDSVRQRVLLFGGFGSRFSTFEELGDLWELSAQGWSLVKETPGFARRNHAMAYDRLRKNLVVFGGVDRTNTGLTDTLVFDGRNWSVVPSGFSNPVQPLGHTLVWDDQSGDLVIYGGQQGDFLVASTAALNGQAWSSLVVVGDTPPVRTGHAMVYDASRKSMVLFGGRGGAGVGTLGDTWVMTR